MRLLNTYLIPLNCKDPADFEHYLHIPDNLIMLKQELVSNFPHYIFILFCSCQK
jgi:hypothetical protein